MMNKSPSTKRESDALIDVLGLNRVPEIIVYFNTKRSLQKIEQFIHETLFSYYGMRSLKSGQIFKHAVPRDQVVNELYEFEDGVKICESMYDFDNNNLVLQGYIYMDRSYNVICEANDEPGMSNRRAMLCPKYKWYFSDVEDHAPRVLVNTGILDLITKHELFDVVLEFTYYNVPVGRNKEKLLIWEIRNY